MFFSHRGLTIGSGAPDLTILEKTGEPNVSDMLVYESTGNGQPPNAEAIADEVLHDVVCPTHY